MEGWNHIINTAMLGTDKKQVGAEDLSPSLREACRSITANSTLDKEEVFLQTAAVIYNYRQCGVLPLYKQDISRTLAEPETLTYCSADASRVLTEILELKNEGLTRLWLEECAAHARIVKPDHIPALMEWAESNKNLRDRVIHCCGNRGKWISSLNPAWAFAPQQTAKELWREGTTAQRKKVLQQQRETDPAEARQWLEETWAAENANTKAELIEQLAINLSENDVQWLEGLKEEKSQKVREVTHQLLKQIPISSIVSHYRDVVSQSVALKKEKALLGMINKTGLKIALVMPGEDVFKTGIQKLSPGKDMGDEDFILYQLVQHVPPDFWETHFNVDAKKVVQILKSDQKGKIFLPAVIDASIAFKNIKWAELILLDGELFRADLLPLLEEPVQDKMSIAHFEKDVAGIIHQAMLRRKPWSLELTKKIFKHQARNYYVNNFFSECIRLVPESILPELEDCAPQEEHYKNFWQKTSDHIRQLIALRTRALKAFQS